MKMTTPTIWQTGQIGGSVIPGKRRQWPGGGGMLGILTTATAGVGDNEARRNMRRRGSRRKRKRRWMKTV